MLDENEIKEIEDLFNQGKSDYYIGKEKHHSTNTIKRKREIYEKKKKNQMPNQETYFPNAIDMTKDTISHIEKYIQIKELSEKQRKREQRILEKQREIVRTEVDERIASERADAIEKRDQDWNNIIQQKFVEKEVVTNLENKIKSLEEYVEELKNEINEKEIVHEKDQTDICNLGSNKLGLENQIQILSYQIVFLNNENQGLRNYIDNRLDNEVRQQQEQLMSEQKEINRKKTDFNKYEDARRKNLNAMFQEIDQTRRNLEVRENEVSEREEKLRKQEMELEVSKNQWNKQYSEITVSIEKRVEDIAYNHCGIMVKRCFEKQINEINEERKKIMDQKEQLTKEEEILKKTTEQQRMER